MTVRGADHGKGLSRHSQCLGEGESASNRLESGWSGGRFPRQCGCRKAEKEREKDRSHDANDHSIRSVDSDEQAAVGRRGGESDIHYYVRWTGTEWQRRFIAHGRRDPFNLSNLADVPLAANDRYEIWQGTTVDGGLTFSWQPITVGSTSDYLRPIIRRITAMTGALFGSVEPTRTTRTTRTTTPWWSAFSRISSGCLIRMLFPVAASLAGHPAQARLTRSWATEICWTSLTKWPGAATSRAFPIPAPLSGSRRALFRVEEQ